MRTDKDASTYPLSHRRRVLNVKPSKDTQNDWRVEHAIAAGILPHESSIPASIDLREPWWSAIRRNNRRGTGA
jgi:hypothetical protein